MSNDRIGTSEHLLGLALRSAGQASFDWHVSLGTLEFLAPLPPDLPNVNIGKITNSPEIASQLTAGASVCRTEVQLREGDSGTWIWASVYGEVVAHDAQQRATRIIGILCDISERKLADAYSARTAAMYTTLSQTNQAILRAQTREALFDDICRIAVEFGKFQMANIRILNPVSKLMEPVASAGAGDGAAMVAAAVVSIDPNLPIGQGPSGIAMRTNHFSVANDLFDPAYPPGWHDNARQLGIRSGASFPFESRGRPIGVLVLLSAKIDFFDDAMCTLLVGITQKISSALEHFDRLAQRTAIEVALADSEKFKDAILLASLDCIVSFNERGAIIDFNPAAERTFGQRRQAVMGADFTSALLAPQSQEEYQLNMRQFFDAGSSPMMNRRIELSARHAEGMIFPVEIAIVPIYLRDQRVFTAYLRDISEAKQSQALLRDSEARYRNLIDLSPEAILVHQKGKFVLLNEACVQLFGAQNAQQLLGQDVLPFMHPDHRERGIQRARELPMGVLRKVFVDEVWLRCDQTPFYTEVAASKFMYLGGRAIQLVMRDVTAQRLADDLQQVQSQILGMIATGAELPDILKALCDFIEARSERARCVIHTAGNAPSLPADASWPLLGKNSKILGTICLLFPEPRPPNAKEHELIAMSARLAGIAIEKKEAEDRILHLAHYDELTGLPNRTLFHQILTHAMKTATRGQQRLAVLFVDLDRFKNLNDTLGHDAGDLALQEIASRMRQCLRDADTVARMGGDEFYILIEDLEDSDHAARIARKILVEAGRSFIIHQQECRLTASIGVAMFPEDGTDTQTLQKNADIAMYRAKADGNNTYQFYSASKNVHSLGRLALESQLRRGIDNHEFVLQYQPKVNLASGEISGVEALVRWMHPQQGMLAPNYFIPLAEETSLIIPLGKQILEMACRDALVINLGSDRPVRVAVNLSARQFDDADFLTDLRHILKTTGLDTDYLQLEVTESMVMHNPEQAVRVMTELQAMGIRLDIDDFGTGYSSLTYLKRFPVYSLKIDRSFIQDLQFASNDVAITKAIIAMGHSMGLRIIAEGVEVVEQMDALRQFGCDEFQGFYFSRPIALADFISLQRSRSDSQLPLQ